MQALDLIKPVEMNGRIFNVTMASAVDQRAVMFRLAKFGMEPMLREMAMAITADEMGVFKDSRLVSLSIIGTMIGRMPESDFNFICDKMLAKVSSDGEMISINTFQGDMQSYTQLMILALGVNFASFRDLLSQIFKSTPTGETQENKDQETPPSTGSSGDPASA